MNLFRLASAVLCALPLWAMAQTFPGKPVRMIVPWPPGMPADVSGRIVAERLAAGLGQPVVVENKPGAAGTIGMSEVLRQPADGHTLYMLSSASLVAPMLFPGQSIDFGKSLQPVGMVAWSYNVLVVPTASALKETHAACRRLQMFPPWPSRVLASLCCVRSTA